MPDNHIGDNFWVNIGLGNGLVLPSDQAITWTNVD